MPLTRGSAMPTRIVSWHAIKAWIKASPAYRSWYLGRERQRFFAEPDRHLCFGVFQSFEQARAWLPKSRVFDDESLAGEFVDVRTRQIFAYDYPVIYWLTRAIGQGARTVLDIGGSVGVHYPRSGSRVCRIGPRTRAGAGGARTDKLTQWVKQDASNWGPR